MHDKDLYWLAGLLEGEGSFMRPMPSEPNRPRISLHMTDKDVIDRVNHLFNLTYAHAKIDPRNTSWKTSYRIVIRGKKAVTTMSLLYPLMGKRRKSQIVDAIGEQFENSVDFTAEQGKYWLAGYLEGEGAFVAAPTDRSTRPSIRISTTDEDVIYRASNLMGTKYFGPYKVSKDASERWKLRYMCILDGQPAIALMKILHPEMGQRRQQQIDAALASYQPKGLARGERHGQSKLTSEQVSQIKARLRAGEKLTSLAREYGVDQGLIWQIKAGRIWQQVD